MKNIEYVLLAFISLFIFNINVCAYKDYNIGEIVNLNNMEFYVIKNSSADDNYVTVIKKDPLKTTEIQQYGSGHINKYTQWNSGLVNDYNGYGAIAYYTSEDCRFNVQPKIEDGCTNAYNQSDIKYVVDSWTNGEFTVNQLKEVSGYKARLITAEELNDNLGCKMSSCDNSPYEWIYESYYGQASTEKFYWTMSGWVNAYHEELYTIKLEDWVSEYQHVSDVGMIRPVINILKTALDEADEGDSDSGDLDEEIIEIVDDENIDAGDIDYENDKGYEDSNYNISEKVEVPNTLKRLSIVGIVVGIGLIALSIIFIVRHKKTK